MSTKLSVITCDLEGRIETFNEGASAMFGYTPDEVIGKKRVSVFSPGHVVLAHINTWLSTAREKGKYEGRTVFVKKDGTPFPADIRITPTFKNGQQIGYCGVTHIPENVSVESAMPKIGLATRIFSGLVVTRAPFLVATLLPILFAGAWVGVTSSTPFPWAAFGLAILGGLALHVAANVFNDYFDWKSGTDEANNEYFLPYSGGSRSVELGLVKLPTLALIGTLSLLVAVGTGLLLIRHSGTGILWFGVAGAFSAFFYTAPPLRLVARKGMGELLVGMNFGPLLVAGTTYALTGRASWESFVIGLPLGLLTTAILWVNQFPDAKSDEATGKHHLVVVLGKKTARLGYIALLTTAFLALAGLVVAKIVPMGVLLALLGLPLAYFAARTVWKHFEDRQLVKASAWTIQLQALVGALMALGCLLHAV